MANMSYCAFENTYRAIVQLQGMIEEAQQEAGCDGFYMDELTDEDKAKIVAALDLNEHEIRAWDSLAESMGELKETMEFLAPEGVEELLAGTVHARR
jgi:hypothetical protein